MVSVTDQVQCGRPVGNMAEYVDGSEKAPLHESRSSSTAAAGGGKRATQKPDWTRFGLSGGDGEPPRRRPGGGDGSTLTGNEEDAGEVNEIYAEHEVCTSDSLLIAHLQS